MKRIKLTAVLIIALCICALIICTACMRGEKTLLILGEKYLDDLEYEKAVFVFEQAIKAEPRSAQGYIGLYNAYIAMGESNSAKEALETGYKNTNSEEIKKLLDEFYADPGITYPILFIDGNGGYDNCSRKLYWIKEYGTEPVLVDDAENFDSFTYIAVNPVDPNRIMRYDEGKVYELYLDSAPDTRKELIDILEDPDAGVFGAAGYSPDGTSRFTDLHLFGKAKNYIRFFDVKYKNIEKVYNPYNFIFQDESPCFFYIDTEENNTLKRINLKTGETEDIISLPADGVYEFCDMDGSDLYIWDTKDFWEEYNYDLYKLYKCDTEKKILEYIGDASEDITYMNTKNDVKVICKNSEDDIINDREIYIQGNRIDLNFVFDWSKYDGTARRKYLNIVDMGGGAVLLAYNDENKNEIIRFKNGEKEVIFVDDKYAFLQLLNGNELLLAEYSEDGTKNLVVYNIREKTFTCAYEGLNGNFDLINTYPGEKNLCIRESFGRI